MNVYIVADLEGVSGIGCFDTYRDRVPGEFAKKQAAVTLWTAEINASIKGAILAGASRIVVIDNHGSGNNLSLADIASPAQLIHGKGRNTWLPMLDPSFDALICVGQHAMAQAPAGHLAHTYSRKHLDRVVLNGCQIGEFGLIAGIAASFGVPTVFISGDQAAVSEAQSVVSNIRYVATKIGLSRSACVSRPADIVRGEIRDGVRTALENSREIIPTVLDPPFDLTVDYRPTRFWRVPARCLLRRKGGTWSGFRRVRIRDNNLQRLWDRFVGLSE